MFGKGMKEEECDLLALNITQTLRRPRYHVPLVIVVGCNLGIIQQKESFLCP